MTPQLAHQDKLSFIEWLNRIENNKPNKIDTSIFRIKLIVAKPKPIVIYHD